MNQLIKFETSTGMVELSPQIIRSYLVNGNGKVTDQEVELFTQLCKYRGLNPFLKEAHLIKYGDNAPAQVVVSYDVFKNRADNNPHNKGYKAGIILLNNDEIVYRTGALKLTDEELIGGWCEVERDDRNIKTRVEVSFDEYVQKKKDGTVNKQWASKPAFMIRKVAIAQGLREAYPNDLNGLYSEEENAPITSTQPTEEIIEGEVVENITMDEAKQLYVIAGVTKDNNDNKTLVTQALLMLNIFKKEEDIKLLQITKADYPKIVEKVKELKEKLG